MIDLTILRVLKTRAVYLKYIGSVYTPALEQLTKVLLDDFGEYFQKTNVERIELEPFWTWFSKVKHKTMSDEQKPQYRQMIQNAMKDVESEVHDLILQDLREVRLTSQVQYLLDQVQDGNVESFFDAVKQPLTEYQLDSGIVAPTWIQTSIGDLLQQEIDNTGITWRLSCLNQSCRGLREGDMGIVAGRPDKGKTTFFASELTHMAGQLPPDKNVVWLNNEGLGSKIIPRLYQAALGVTLSELVELNNSGKLIDAYSKTVGRLDRIRVFDIHGYNTSRVEHIIEESNAGIVVADMIDHIKGFKGEARTDLQLEEMYKWFRELCVKYSCIGFASSQISNEGDGLQFPTLGMLKDSKTGKQGACDFQIMIGASNDPNLAGLRFIGMPKNKLRRDGFAGDPRAEVIFNPSICRYTDIPIGE